MKAKEVLEVLRISRPTLARLVKKGEIKAKRLPNGRLDYDPESVYRYLLEKNRNCKKLLHLQRLAY